MPELKDLKIELQGRHIVMIPLPLPYLCLLSVTPYNLSTFRTRPVLYHFIQESEVQLERDPVLHGMKHTSILLSTYLWT